MSDPATITIPLSEYQSLLCDRQMLRALQAGGVDNWEGYHESVRHLGPSDDEESEEDIYGP